MDEPTTPERRGDLISDRLFKARTVIITGEINQRVAATVTGQLLALAAESDETITIYINSPGGHVESGDTIHDLIRFLTPKVRMVGTGWVASAAALIYVAAPKEDRLCLPNTRFLLHQPAGGTGGTASDIEIEAREIIRMRDRLNRVFAAQTGQPLERIVEDTHRNFWLSAEEAIAYGIAGRVIRHQSEL
ncbi:MAG: ATP-dependent Clp protease proteolytic subunit [Gemmatimonadales bacterium]